MLLTQRQTPTLSLSSVWEDFTIVAHWKVYESALIHVERGYVCVCVWLPQKKMSFVARARTKNIVYFYACVCWARTCPCGGPHHTVTLIFRQMAFGGYAARMKLHALFASACESHVRRRCVRGGVDECWGGVLPPPRPIGLSVWSSWGWLAI